MIKINMEDGYYLFKLNELLTKYEISKNQLMRETNTDFKVIQRMINGELTKLDLIVLARICNFLNCHISDIIEYYPNLILEKEKVEN